MSEEQDRKAYYCLTCQKPLGMRQIKSGACLGHLVTDFVCHDEATVSDVGLMRRFREKVEKARRYVDLRLRAGT